MIAHGLKPRAVIPDGDWHRCPTVDKPRSLNGSYKLWPSGKRGLFRNFALHDDCCEWRDEHASVVPSQEIQRQMRENREREQQRRIAAIDAARAHWEGAKPAGLHPYVQRKGLSIRGMQDLRECDGKLLVPMYKGSSLMSIQTIDADGEKRFWTGAPTKGASFEIAREGAPITCLCEGLATGLAIFQSVPQARVIVAFSSDQLLPAVEHLQLRGAVVVCADNDHGTLAARGFNPGLLAAQKVVDATGCGMAYPTDIEGTDWADAFKEWGKRAPSRIRREILRAIRMVRAKGMNPMASPAGCLD
jgi:putative DNA primase/helicase